MCCTRGERQRQAESKSMQWKVTKGRRSVNTTVVITDIAHHPMLPASQVPINNLHKPVDMSRLRNNKPIKI